jgi:hypothetical protein
VLTITLVIDQNPAPMAAKFELGPFAAPSVAMNTRPGFPGCTANVCPAVPPANWIVIAPPNPPIPPSSGPKQFFRLMFTTCRAVLMAETPVSIIQLLPPSVECQIVLSPTAYTRRLPFASNGATATCHAGLMGLMTQ